MVQASLKKIRMYAAISAFPAAIMSTVVLAQQEPAKWNYSASLATMSATSYLGDDDQQLSLFPDIQVTYSDRFFASILGGIGYNLINAQGWRAGPIAQLNLGRFEDGDNPLLIAGDETEDLVGLGDIDPSIELGGFVEYTYQRVQGNIEVRQDTGGGHEGLVVDLGLKYTGSVQIAGKSGFYSIGPELLFGDDDYISAFFDVDAQQSAASGLPEYDADAGVLSYGLHGSLYYPINQTTSLVGLVGYDRITGDAEKSSLVEQRGSVDEFLVGVLVTYEF